MIRKIVSIPLEHPRLTVGLFLVGSLLLLRAMWESKTKDELAKAEQNLRRMNLQADVIVPDDQNALGWQIKAINVAPKTPRFVSKGYSGSLFDEGIFKREEFLKENKVVALNGRDWIVIHDSLKEAQKEASFDQAFKYLEKARDYPLAYKSGVLQPPFEEWEFVYLFSALGASAKHNIGIEKYSVAVDRLYDAVLIQQTLNRIGSSIAVSEADSEDDSDLTVVSKIIFTLPAEELRSLRPGLERILKRITADTYGRQNVHTSDYVHLRSVIQKFESDFWLIHPGLNEANRGLAEVYLRQHQALLGVMTPPRDTRWADRIFWIGLHDWVPDWIPYQKLYRARDQQELAGQIGLILHLLDHGDWPDSLEGLSPEYIPDTHFFENSDGERLWSDEAFKKLRIRVTPAGLKAP